MPQKIRTTADLHSVLIETGMLKATHGIHLDVSENNVTIQRSTLDEQVDNTLLESQITPGFWVLRSAPEESVFHFRWHPGEPAARTEYIMAVDSNQWSTVQLINTDLGILHVHKAL